jgi:hypothetical protein
MTTTTKNNLEKVLKASTLETLVFKYNDTRNDFRLAEMWMMIEEEIESRVGEEETDRLLHGAK